MKRKQRGSTEEVLPQSSGLHALLNTHTHTHTHTYSHTHTLKLSHTVKQAHTDTPRLSTHTHTHTHTHTDFLTYRHTLIRSLLRTHSHRGLQQGLLGNIRHPGRKEDRLFPHLDSVDTSDVRLKIEPMLNQSNAESTTATSRLLGRAARLTKTQPYSEDDRSRVENLTCSVAFYHNLHFKPLTGHRRGEENEIHTRVKVVLHANYISHQPPGEFVSLYLKVSYSSRDGRKRPRLYFCRSGCLRKWTRSLRPTRS